MALGLGQPVGSLGAARTTGPLVRVGAVIGDPHRHVRLRVDAEGAWMSRAGERQAPGWQSGDFRTVDLLSTLLVGPTGTNRAVYGLAGIGVHWAAIKATSRPYGAVPGLQFGLGARGKWRGVQLHSEVVPHVLLSDYGAASETAGMFLALVLGTVF